MTWLRTLALGIAGALSAGTAAAQTKPAEAPTQVMVVGMFHFANPGLDYRNLAVDDVLAPARQREIEGIVDALARFRPTVIGTEWRPETAAASFRKYLDGTLPPSRDETVQLAFRLGKQAVNATVLGMDAPASLPFGPVMAYAKSHGQQAFIDHVGTVSEANVAEQDRLLKTVGIAGVLRLLSDPVKARRDHMLYTDTLRIGDGAEQPGVNAVAVWYRRNLAICANILQAARPGGRMIVFFGGGHLHLLRQCLSESSGITLVDARDYLPRVRK
ncbi:hypothetical protein ASE86_05650 [Sphingomonas sp. Leaf33]|uniref:DUF5694 domain-containing protein n=1 Tax=Sphingomonas sp. Leaf33 TaxID=1736215 RepID=UPI0006FC14CE|nr:DUF5694 domain-containing protein [Sphingomonas sp. Leaf33]KQN25693.1 hypothetical protein ASE86_05650 [Sphingomonas sp. Leaf33]